ncbi:hypothetical protein PVAP13_2KG097448 [Panicum virgatum]|uniref:Uncharacterized protein n=1 Tax=Panicum virgatum TaxID=38727 RepID=A0A8T0W594_PANVG|nr:hypothetical protein PVAP13_2KG097448 [Panicum virgatum]
MRRRALRGSRRPFPPGASTGGRALAWGLPAAAPGRGTVCSGSSGSAGCGGVPCGPPLYCRRSLGASSGRGLQRRVLSGRLVADVGRWVAIVGLCGGLTPPVPSVASLDDGCRLVPLKLRRKPTQFCAGPTTTALEGVVPPFLEVLL